MEVTKQVVMYRNYSELNVLYSGVKSCTSKQWQTLAIFLNIRFHKMICKCFIDAYSTNVQIDGKLYVG